MLFLGAPNACHVRICVNLSCWYACGKSWAIVLVSVLHLQCCLSVGTSIATRLTMCLVGISDGYHSWLYPWQRHVSLISSFQSEWVCSVYLYVQYVHGGMCVCGVCVRVCWSMLVCECVCVGVCVYVFACVCIALCIYVSMRVWCACVCSLCVCSLCVCMWYALHHACVCVLWCVMWCV